MIRLLGALIFMAAIAMVVLGRPGNGEKQRPFLSKSFIAEMYAVLCLGLVVAGGAMQVTP